MMGPWSSYQGQPGQAYMLGQAANNLAQGFPQGTAIPPPSNPFQNLQQTQQNAALANANLAAGGTGAIGGGGIGGFIDKLTGGNQQQGNLLGNATQQFLAQGTPHTMGQTPSMMPPMQGQMPGPQGLLSQLGRSVLPNQNGQMAGGFTPTNVLPANAANNFNGMGMQAYLRARGG